ncbi:(2Fe-2S) ferredoxin domain-containing protein [Haloplasma contractile]|uniref:NADH dehydrogenase I subunit F protein n=1 Tax=Haloplasma contractile SSD-17B TaxID=1033810 RepID=U2E7B5_9MOLU|nr:(2Fe-2S) ferredoxin domain-containing protein [Haloplasma contractile]ERJ11093.1 NADH dehydrogenase I subunit F protein [Haloplasma contractile SSD-17B]
MKSLEDLKKIREATLKNLQLRNQDESEQVRIVVGMGTCGISAGARPVLNAIVEELNKRNISGVSVVQTGCVGMCRLEPMFDLYKNGEKVTYVNMTPEKSREVVAEHVVNNHVVSGYTIGKTE